MTLANELFDIGQGFWLSGKEHFLEHVDQECLLAFPQLGEMHELDGWKLPLHQHSPVAD